VDECVEEYLKLSKSVFEVDKVLKGIIPVGDNQCRFDFQKLEDAIKDVVQKKSGDANSKMADTTEAKVPTFVVATKALHAESPPTLFRSYRCRGHNASTCAIWEAARATSAAPTFFKEMKIATPPLPAQTFVDGGLTYNNPAELALAEGQRIWTSASKFCVVSIGTGRLKAVPVVKLYAAKTEGSSKGSSMMNSIPGVKTVTKIPPGLRTLKNMAEACLALATNSEPAHQRLLRQSSNREQSFPYHRFNVARDMQDIGLQEWGKAEEIAAHTAVYMEETEGEFRRDRCVQDLMNLRP
jgi:predicted acylesterase/phospholipase RssA